ncbi:MAG: hypothetical protein ABL984_18785 [Pyrinomonadaceae bacterium]
MLFEVSAQYSYQDHNESTDLGTKSAADVLKCFDEFDWEHEVSEATRLGKVSPTLSVEDKVGQRLIWVSGYSNPKFPSFVSDCTFPGMAKRFFGLLGEGMGVVELHTEGFNTLQARQALEFFVTNDEAALRQLYQAA